MKFNQSLTAAVTAAALVAGAGFAFAQNDKTVTNQRGGASAQGPLGQNTTTDSSTTLQAQPSSSTTTMQAQPSSSTTTMDNSAPLPSVDNTLEPRADRN